MAPDNPSSGPSDVQAAIAAALARKRAQADPNAPRVEPHFTGGQGGHQEPIGPVPLGDDEPATEIPPMPQYFKLDEPADQEPVTVRREAPPRTRKRSLIWFFTPIVAVPAVILIALFYYLGIEMQGAGVQDSAVLIEAPSEPAKVKPTEEGGLAVPNQDKLIYNEIDPEDSQPETEQLLPPPEEPQVPPTMSTDTAEAAPAAGTETTSSALPEAPAVELPGAEGTSAEAAAEAAPVPDATPAAGETTAAAPVEAAPAATQTAAIPADAYRIQLAALKSEAAASEAWTKLQKQYPDLLTSLQPIIEKVDLGASGVFYRIQGGPLDSRNLAQDLCGKLNQRGQQCIVVRP